jgi:WD40 repeat protein
MRRAVQLEEVRRFPRGHIVFSLAQTPDGRRVLLPGRRDMVVWNVGEEAGTKLEFRGESVALAPDGRTAATCGTSVKIQLGNIDDGTSIRELHSGGMCISVDFSPDGARLVSGSIGKQAVVWDVANGDRVCVFEKHNAPLTDVAFLPAGDEVASNGQDKALRVWNAKTGAERLAIPHPEVPWAMAISPDGRLIATGTGGPTVGNPIMHRVERSLENTIRFWDAASGELVREMKGHTNVIYGLDFSPDGRTLASGSWDGSVRLWDVASGQELASAEGQGSVYAVAFTPDGGELLVGGGEHRAGDGSIRRYPNEQLRQYRIVERDSATHTTTAP